MFSQLPQKASVGQQHSPTISGRLHDGIHLAIDPTEQQHQCWMVRNESEIRIDDGRRGSQ